MEFEKIKANFGKWIKAHRSNGSGGNNWRALVQSIKDGQYDL